MRHTSLESAGRADRPRDIWLAQVIGASFTDLFTLKKGMMMGGANKWEGAYRPECRLEMGHLGLPDMWDALKTKLPHEAR